MRISRTIACFLACFLATGWLPALAPAAWGQQTTFDYDAPGPHQQGSYAPDSAVALSSGVARLRAQQSPAWQSPGWGFRLGVTLTNPGGQSLTDHPVRIDLRDAPALLYDEARLDGADLLPVVAASGAAVTDYWVESLDFISRTGALWVKLPTLPPGTTELLVYFGNPGWIAGGDPETFFSHPGGWVSRCVVSPVAAQLDLVVESFVDGNTITLEGTAAAVTLDTRERGTFAAAELDRLTYLRATGALQGAFDGDDADVLAPLSFAATRLVAPAVRYEERFDVVSPFGTAQVDVYDNGALLASATVGDVTPVTLDADAADGHVIRVEADLPVLVHKHGWNSTGGVDSDAFVMVAPARELLGGNSGTSYLVAAEDGTVARIWYSSGDYEEVTLDRTDSHPLLHGGSQGDGDAVRVEATAPVMAVSHADGDGGEAMTFLPARELGRRFLLPLGAQYLLVATWHPATTCEILDAAGAVTDSQQSNTYGANYPNRLRFTGVAAGHELRCDQPVWAMFEEPLTDTERNLWPIKLHRPRVHPSPWAALSAVEPRYPEARGTVISPTFVAPFAVAQWTAFIETADVPAGAWLRYQLSVDEGQSWQHYDGQQWADASTLEAANPWWEVHLHLDELSVEANQLTVKAILGSETGAVSPELDTVQVLYTQQQDAEQLVFEPISSPQIAGIPFPITVRATDALGRTIESFDGPVAIQTLGQPTSPGQSPPFSAGEVTFEVAVAEVGSEVQLYAYAGAVSGTSAPFEVLAPSGETLEYVSGDQQFALGGTEVPAPLVVRALDDEGQPASGVAITFAVTAGDGTVLPAPSATGEPGAELVAETDPDGRAAVRWQLGPRTGAQRVEARLAGAAGSPVVFVARADYNPDLDYFELRGEGGGCSCRSGGADPAPWLALWLLGGVGLLWRRRRRRR